LSAEDTLEVQVREVNRPPVLAPVGDRRVEPGGQLATSPATASDPDIPANTLRFSLPLSPPGPVLDPATGAVSWAPATAGTFGFALRVTDDGTPPLSSERRFDVTVASAPAPETPAELLLACSDRSIVLEELIPKGRRVEVLGVAARRFAGRTAEVVYEGSRRVVARTRVGADGAFRAMAPLPPARERASNRARYSVRIGSERSLALKLVRRMTLGAIRVSGHRVTLTGRITPPLAARPRDRVIEVRQRVACGREKVVAKLSPRRNGAFSGTVEAPPGAAAAVYRLHTRVRASTRSAATADTFTMPRAVAFGG
jgi:hypothetical protein